MDVRRPPFLVPHSDHNLWDEQDERDYTSWKRRACNSKLTKDDFRNHIIDINNEFNMEDVFDRLDIGFEAFEKLVAFRSKHSKYNLVKDLEGMYEGKENFIVKDFIKWGENFVRTYQVVHEIEEEGESEEMMETSKSDGKDLKISSVMECPILPFDSPPEPLCLSPGWGTFLPSHLPPISSQFSQQQHQKTLWRPWLMEADKSMLKRSSEAGQDPNKNSPECPLLPAAVHLTPPLHATPKPDLSPYSPSPQRKKVKRRRSLGDLGKRRQRLISFQLSHTPPSTPCNPEPDQFSLESGYCGDSLGSWREDTTPSTSRQESLHSFGTPRGHRRPVELDSNLTNHNLLHPLSSQSLWPAPGWVSTPLPAPCQPPAWLSSNMAPPSPAFCDGCQRWGNLLSVTVSQSRPP